MNNVWVYDVETLANCFTVVFKNIVTKENRCFVVHNNRNDYLELISFLLSEGLALIGFNNLGFDYPILHFIMNERNHIRWERGNFDGDTIARDIYGEAQRIINSQDGEYGRSTGIRPWDIKIPQLDLYKIWHFDNVNKATSLKWVQFAMRQLNLQDMPIHHKQEIGEYQIDEVIQYNINDVESTYEFYKLTKGEMTVELADLFGNYKGQDQISMRRDFSLLYNSDFMNYNDTKIGEKMLLKLYCDTTGHDPRVIKDLRTHRTKINLGEIIFDYIKFKSPEFNAIRDFFASQVVTPQLSGVFTMIPAKKVGNLNLYISRSKDMWDNKKKQVKKLNCIFKNFLYVYGAGGIHGSQVGQFFSDDEYIIIDADVASLYPSIAVQNNLFPEHLGPEFCKVYDNDIVSRRLALKAKKDKTPGDKVLIAALKLAANGSYGKSKSEYSFLYDPAFTLGITINGQLLLTMLAEMLILAIGNDLEMIQINTDGLTVRIPRRYQDTYYKICKEWEVKTNLMLEFANYKSFHARNVNNYIAEYENGKLKVKGAYEPEPEIHKNHSMRVVKLAVKEFFTKGVPIETTIKQHKDIFDFMIGTKANSGWAFLSRYIEGSTIYTDELQKTIRYIVSNNGATLKKYSTNTFIVEKEPSAEMKNQLDMFTNKPVVIKEKVGDQENHLEAGGWKVTILNDIREKSLNAHDYDIDYRYYIREANKLINDIIDPNQTKIL